MADNGKPEWLNPRFYAMAGAAIVLLIVVIFMNMGGKPAVRLSDPESTHDTMARLTSLVQSFIAREQRTPASLDEAAPGAPVTDGWGHAITLTLGTEGSKKTSFVLRSNGPDGQPETPDDWVTLVKFGDDGYGKLGVEGTETKEGQQ